MKEEPNRLHIAAFLHITFMTCYTAAAPIKTPRRRKKKKNFENTFSNTEV